jgi:hypothetical protein
MQIQGTTAEPEEIENATDTLLVRDLATSLMQREGSFAEVDYEAIETLLWLSPDGVTTYL